MKQSEFDKIIDKVNQSVNDNYFTEEKIVERMKNISGKDTMSLQDAIIFNVIESKTYTEDYIYSVLKEVLKVEPD